MARRNTAALAIEDRERRDRSLFLDLICGFRETRVLAIKDNKAGFCDV